MSKFTITVNDAQIEKFILNMLSLLKNNPGIDFKKEGNNFVINTNDNEEHLMLAGKPFTWEELISDVAESESEYEAGEFKTTKDLKDDIKDW